MPATLANISRYNPSHTASLNGAALEFHFGNVDWVSSLEEAIRIEVRNLQEVEPHPTKFSNAVLSHFTKICGPLAGIVNGFRTGYASDFPFRSVKEELRNLASLAIPSPMTPADQQALNSLQNVMIYVAAKESNAEVLEVAGSETLSSTSGTEGFSFRSWRSWLSGMLPGSDQ